MKFEVYCDESHPDLLCSEKPPARFMVIGSLWLKTENRDSFKREIHKLRDIHKVGGEFKWQKASTSRIAFYNELVDFFSDMGEELRFRCIAVDHDKVDLFQYHDSDQELGFYKFYYQMLHHWIMDFNTYSVFCDFKVNRQNNRLHVLQRCLGSSNLSAEIGTVQAVRSKESVLLQLCDVLTGAAAARLNGSLKPQGAKTQVLDHIEHRLGRKIAHTAKAESKFNVFVINLQGGW